MKKIVALEEIGNKLKKLKADGGKIVLAGGCFDIIHAGHLEFLKNAKREGNILVIVLESDESIKKLKGKKRPIHNQSQRAKILSSISEIDYIIPIPMMSGDKDYNRLVKTLEPDIIAVTKGDPIINKKRDHAKSVGARVIEVMERMKEFSTSSLARKIK